MIELPESQTIARHINKTLSGKRVASVLAAFSPHKFAWYHNDPAG
jgi:formamidopyrimidine-DNA glycosylase